jgi:hypothetical protein
MNFVTTSARIFVSRSRHGHDRDPANQKGHDERQKSQWSQDLEGRHSSGVHDDQLAVAVQLVQRVKDSCEKRDRCDDHDQGRQGQQRHLQEHQQGLSLAGNEIHLLQGRRQPDDPGERDKANQECPACNPEDVTFEERHGSPGLPLAQLGRLPLPCFKSSWRFHGAPAMACD